MKKFEEEFWDRPPVRRVPDLEPDFDKFKREYLDKMEPITEEERRSIAERNRQLLVKRARQKRRILSMAACAAVAVGVVGTAIWLGHDGAVVPHPESGAEETDSVVSTTETTETDGTTETTDRHVDDNVLTYDEVVQLTGLPLVKADDMAGFVEYRVDEENLNPEWVKIAFDQGLVYIYGNKINSPELLTPYSVVYENKTFYVEKSTGDKNETTIKIRYDSSTNDVTFWGRFSNISVDEAIQILNTLVF